MVKLLKTEKLSYCSGWDVTIEFSNETKRQNMTFYWPRKDQPDEKILADKFKYLEAQFNEPEPIPEKTYLQSEVDVILIQKKYITTAQHFPGDLSVKPNGGK